LNITVPENLESLSKAIMNFERPITFSSPLVKDYDAILDEIMPLLREQRIVFVIDEFSYIVKEKPRISAIPQHVFKHRWNDSKFYLILCSSNMSFMEKQVLGHEDLLYGRRIAQFKFEP